jgi:hypothetical protein
LYDLVELRSIIIVICNTVFGELVFVTCGIALFRKSCDCAVVAAAC